MVNHFLFRLDRAKCRGYVACGSISQFNLKTGNYFVLIYVLCSSAFLCWKCLSLFFPLFCFTMREHIYDRVPPSNIYTRIYFKTLFFIVYFFLLLLKLSHDHVCPSVGRSVGWSVSWSVGRSHFIFL